MNNYKEFNIREIIELSKKKLITLDLKAQQNFSLKLI